MEARAVVFDWCGTVVRSNEAVAAACRAATSAVLGQTYPATPLEEQMLFQLGERETLRMLCDGGDPLARLTSAFTEHYVRSLESLETYPHVDRVMHSLRELGWVIVVVSNGDRERVLDEQRRTGLSELIHASLFSDESESWIPHPAPLLAALDAVDAVPAASIVVGDAPADLRAGRAAGMITAAALYGYESDRIDDDLADIRLEDACQLLEELAPYSEIEQAR